MKQNRFNIAHINRCTESEGPFKRFAIWFQGCDILCDGCCNPELQPLKPRNIMALDDLMALVSKAFSEYGIEGVTYLGGEPTLQKNLHELSKTIHMVGLGIIMFTGREIKDVSPELLEDVDLVIDGHYDKKLQETKRNLVGSSNQRLIHMTGRYASTDWFTKPRLKRVEVNVGGDAVFFSGDVI